MKELFALIVLMFNAETGMLEQAAAPMVFDRMEDCMAVAAYFQNTYESVGEIAAGCTPAEYINADQH